MQRSNPSNQTIIISYIMFTIVEINSSGLNDIASTIVEHQYCDTALPYLVEKTTIFIAKVYFIAIVCSLSSCAD